MKRVNAFGKEIWIKHAVLDKPASDSVVETYSTYKISIMLTDGLAAIVGDKIFVGNKYDIFFFAPDEIHFGRFLRAGRHEFIDFYIPTDFFDTLPDKEALTEFLFDRGNGRINLIRCEEKTKEYIRYIISSVLKNEGAQTEIFAAVLNTVLYCSKNYREHKEKSGTENLMPLVKRALTYIEGNFERKITLSEIAGKMGCSQAYLSRVFKASTGVSVYRHITDVRISNAEKLLLQGKSVTEACFASGFDDCSNFISAFKKVTGITPLKYKKSTD